MKPEKQTAYYQEHPPKCVAAFRVESAFLDHPEFSGHGFSGVYPDSLVINLNIVFAIMCQCSNSTHGIVAESEYQEIWQYKHLVVAERYFLECSSCHSRHLLFDRFLHGYDAETSRLQGLSLHEIIGWDGSLPVKNIVTCQCSHCHKRAFEVFTRFEYPSDLFDEPLFQGREQEFFSWFTGVGKCHTCSRINVFIDYECA